MEEHIAPTGKIPPGNESGPARKPDIRLTPGRNVQLTVPLEDFIDQLVKENKGVDYESVDVLDEEHNLGLRETLKNYSNWPTLPQIFVNGELIGGRDILVSMQEQGDSSSWIPTKVSIIYGVVGTIRLLAGNFFHSELAFAISVRCPSLQLTVFVL
ncbi:Bifunctional monothiol glutaredoxin-s16 protein [Thalictrum thalictroides]|uniref:Bifunctional monothiol glutaredoxin-s16 protein n=1 Tax=Thalictrum thalictroides TaxID=46969 RepID=A0A7J6UUX5_THATH|nr:Bifunctional monothiol glutaredoxin-s16 protein [Thalictrum thalictroides]